MTSIEISVLIPVHSTKYLRETFESLGKSEIEEISVEIVVVLDRLSQESLRSFSESLKNFPHKIIVSKSPGIVSALNLGLEYCEGKFVARIDDDDLLHSQRLRRQRDYLMRHPQTVAVGSSLILIDDAGKLNGISVYPLRHKSIQKRSQYFSPMAHPSVMYRRQSVISVGGYRHDVPEDWDLWIRLMSVGKTHNLLMPLTFYRQHSRQLSRVGALYQLQTARLIISKEHFSSPENQGHSDSRSRLIKFQVLKALSKCKLTRNSPSRAEKYEQRKALATSKSRSRSVILWIATLVQFPIQSLSSLKTKALTILVKIRWRKLLWGLR